MALNMRIYMKKQGTGEFRYYLTSDTTTVSEGETVNFYVTTENVPNDTELTYEITGITNADISAGALVGTMVVQDDLAQTSITVKEDQLTEDPEILTFTVSGTGRATTEVIQTSASLPINDTSTDPTYILSSSVDPVNEGETVTITVDTTNIFDGTLLPYTVTGIQQDDLSVGSLIGNVLINGNSGSVSFTLLADEMTEGVETMTFTLDGLNETIDVIVNDTSTPTGGAVFLSTGTHTWTVPEGVYSISCVAVGGGASGSYQYNPSAGGNHYGGNGGGGGGLGWRNNISVTPGDEITVVVGAGGSNPPQSTTSRPDGSWGQDSYVQLPNLTITVKGGGGGQATGYSTGGGNYTGQGGGSGGNAGTGIYPRIHNGTYYAGTGGGGGGAGGYAGKGGKGWNWAYLTNPTSANQGEDGVGGAGGGAYFSANTQGSAGGQGGSVGIYGQGSHGARATGRGGSGGPGSGGGYGSGGWGRCMYDNNSTVSGPPGNGVKGAVRIVWGSGRTFPLSNVSSAINETSY